MKSRTQALEDAADVLAGVVKTVATLTPAQAAERVWHPGGPPVDELAERIAATGLCAA